MKIKHHLISAAFMLPFAAAAANYSNTTLYIVDNGDDGQGFLNDQTTYAYYDGSNYVQVTAEDTIDWSSVSIVYASNNVLAAGVGGDKNTLRMPEGSNEFHVGGNLEFRNFTDATRAYPNAFGIWRWGISDYGNNLVDIRVDGALKFVDSHFYHGSDNQDWEFKVGISAGSLDLVSNHASDNMYVKFGEGSGSRGLKYLNVANDMTLSGNVRLTMSLNNPSASSYGADYDVNIGGKLKMGSNENNSGTPTMAIGYWGSHVSSGEVQTYFKMSGIDGVGTIQYNNNGVGETCRSYFDIVTKANDTSDFAATIKYNAQNGGTRTNFNVSGAGEQVFRFSADTDERLSLTVSDSAVLRIFADNAANGRTIDVTMNGGTFGTAASAKGAANDGASIYVDSLAWNSGSLLIDLDAGAKITVKDAFSLGSADGLTFAFLGSKTTGDSIAIDDFLAWESASAADYKAAVAGALASGDATVTVNGVAYEYTYDSGLGAIVLGAVPEPAAIAALMGAFAIGFAAFRRRR